LRRNEPPHLIEIEMPQRKAAQMQMAAMRRIERAAEDADAAVPTALPAALDDAGQGRTWPLPRTRYL
jgi:hypothetical protein